MMRKSVELCEDPCEFGFKSESIAIPVLESGTYFDDTQVILRPGPIGRKSVVWVRVLKSGSNS